MEEAVLAWKKKSTRGLPEAAYVTALFSVRVRRASDFIMSTKGSLRLSTVDAATFAFSASHHIHEWRVCFRPTAEFTD